MFVLIVGGGKVGLNTARQLLQLGHEIALVEQRSTRFGIIAEELGDEALVFGDGTEVWVLEKAGIRTVCPTRDVRIALFDAVRTCQLPVTEG